MIVFNTEFTPYFNKKIHQFLLTYLFELYTESDDFAGALHMFFPKHLVREQKEKCAMVMEDLLDWTNDKYWHTMTAFHEVGLYYFLNYVSNLRDDMPEFDSIFYDSEDERQIKKIWNQLDQDLKELFRTPNRLKKHLRDIGTFLEYCFDDTDFLMIPDLSNLRSVNDTTLEQLLGVDFDYYKEILPNDIRTRFEKQTGQLELFNEVDKMLERISQRILYRGLHRAFWKEGGALSEPEIQPLLDSFFDLYFKGDEYVDITRESDLGTGKIDFKFYRNASEKVLIEVKLGSNPHLERGLKKQLIHYMDAVKYSYAFYLIICHSNKEALNATRLYEENKNYNFDGKKIVLCIVDASGKVPASKL